MVGGYLSAREGRSAKRPTSSSCNASLAYSGRNCQASWTHGSAWGVYIAMGRKNRVKEPDRKRIALRYCLVLCYPNRPSHVLGQTMKESKPRTRCYISKPEVRPDGLGGRYPSTSRASSHGPKISRPRQTSHGPLAFFPLSLRPKQTC